MAYQKNEYSKRPSSKETGARTGYEKKNGGKRTFDDRKPYGKKNVDTYEKGERSYGKKPYRKNDDRPFDRTNQKRSFDPEKKPFERTAPQQNENDEKPYLLIGRNAVREAIKSGRSIDRILVTNERDGSLGEIVTLARERKLVVREVDRKKLDELCMPFGHGGKTANHQGVVAYAAGVTYCDVADILQVAKERGEDPFVIVLDEIEDPHNLGSIIRSADCAGAHGVIIGKRRSASVTAAAVKASAGATEYVKIARVVNINAALAQLKAAGVWVAGADMHGEPMRSASMKGPLALVIGNEGEGLSKLVRENCDFLVSIPMQGHIDSLNAGVAAAILMFEKKRQDTQTV